ncbi:TetR/AcrR family transcriptional regulator [Novosphingobium sp.]|uniref:TetR/AcrR family transcriptional regulator n=1 Tax=Novosphingobium sp. TaxID=1874826 RepID=UPI0038B6DAB6
MQPSANPVRSRRGRPTAARVSAIDRAIVVTARTMFLAEGYDTVAMEQVAVLADISKGTLYARYPSKEALFTAVIEASVKEWSDEAALGDDLLTDVIGQRLHHHARTIAMSLQRPDVLGIQRLVLSVRTRFPALARAMHDRGYAYIVGLIAGDIAAAAVRDGVPVRNPQAVAQMLVGAITGFQIQEDADPANAPNLEAFACNLVEVLLAGRAAW